jgi:hypothetical protein
MKLAIASPLRSPRQGCAGLYNPRHLPLFAGYGGEAAEVMLYAFDLLMFWGKDMRLWPFEARRSRLFERKQMGKSTASLI